MNKRIYNIVFDTHTVTGIVISVALYIIFFAGTLSFLREEIEVWEQNTPMIESSFGTTDFDKLLKELEKEISLYSQNISLIPNGKTRLIVVELSKDKPIEEVKKQEAEEVETDYFTIDPTTGQITNYEDDYSLGVFFYQLHFFDPFNLWGYSRLLVGLVTFFFLFTLITGLIIHWDKIVQNFYVFRPKNAWKNIWTEAHTVLGLIGLPYQLMYAITGAFFITGSLLFVEPAQQLVYGGDQKKIDALYEHKDEIRTTFLNRPLQTDFSVNEWVEKAKRLFPNTAVKEINLTHYGDESMLVKVVAYSPISENFTGTYSVVYQVSDEKILQQQTAQTVSYSDALFDIMKHLHFGDYGGYGVKLMYMLLGFLGCVVILSGVLIWLVARDKKNISEHKRKQNQWVANVYLSLCLSMLPATAFVFLIIKLLGEFMLDKQLWIYSLFFGSWGVLSLFFILRRNNFITNRYTLLLSGLWGGLIPIADGLETGNWLWNSALKGETAIFVVNLFWLLVSIITLWVFFKLKKQ